MKRKTARLGVVTVEFALAAPVFILFIFAGVEFARVNMLRNTVENAVYEGARKGILPGATAQDCIDETQRILDIVDLVGTTISVNPSIIEPESATVTVSVIVPIDSTNGYITPQFYLGDTLTSSITLKRERRL